MNEIQYLGEHLWIGKLGHFSIVFSFVISIFTAFSYGFAVNNKNNSEQSTWLIMGRTGYILHGIATFLIMGLIAYMMYNHYYEYAYVQQHVSDDLPLKYVMSAFWEGQEGSFLLWIFWHVILGYIIISRKGKWEAPVMALLAMVEVFLTMMLLGVHIEFGGQSHKIGINPFVLLRDTVDAPIFANADYLSLINGTGLNPLLQNYWMTIHPPVTFLGFASVTVPFLYAVAGLWKRDYLGWLQPSLSWALFSAGILGTGILMGSLWAYEALSFGGYWNWDPVENAVLVPWLTLIAGIHTHLVAKHTGYSVRPTVFLYIISFVLIVYSTFLTRSGVLGDTSAHAFTEMGLETMLIAFQLFFLILGLGWFIIRFKEIPSKKKEESIYSREFWMFIGSLVLLFSAVLIIAATSLPVFNSIITYFNEGYVGRVLEDPIEHYNKYQMWIAIFIAILSGSTLFLRYGENNWSARRKSFLVNMMIALVLAALMTVLTVLWIKLYLWQYYLLTFMAYFSIIASLLYLFRVLKGKLKLASAAIAHFGFGMMIIGILSSGLNKGTISSNPFVFQNIFNKEDAKKYVKLIEGERLYAKGYWMTYESDTLIDRIRYYTIDFKKTKEDGKTVTEEFKLYPDAVYSNDFSKVASFNPDTRHYIHKDIFSCVMALAPTRMDLNTARTFEDTLSYKTYNVQLGDTLHTGNNHYIIDQISYEPKHEEYIPEDNSFGVSLRGRVWNDLDSTQVYPFETALGLQGNLLYKYPYIEEKAGVRIRPADDLMDHVFFDESKLNYKKYIFKTYGEQDIAGFNIKLTGFDQNPSDPSYERQDDDIAIGANLMVTDGEDVYNVSPIYVIRDNSPMGVKSYIPELGIHIRFSNINPQQEEFEFYIAHEPKGDISEVNIELAENLPRTDYIILQANIFPGINLFWLGSILMMIGLFLAMIMRYRKRV